ncbi:MAG: DUF2905 domain-containing protein [Spirochaetales bacterium]|nr:DUF2905 domain-containing protein [Spirochaetales bacterium]MCP5486043.1 DUF2905 domain-containing protein [Spirochaetales bacterium]
MMEQSGRLLFFAGIGLAALGLVLWLGSRLNLRLPGDLMFQKGNLRVYVPLATSLLLSLVLTLIFWLISYFRR